MADATVGASPRMMIPIAKAQAKRVFFARTATTKTIAAITIANAATGYGCVVRLAISSAFSHISLILLPSPFSQAKHRDLHESTSFWDDSAPAPSHRLPGRVVTVVRPPHSYRCPQEVRPRHSEQLRLPDDSAPAPSHRLPARVVTAARPPRSCPL